MADQYIEAAGDERFEAAVTLALRRHLEAPDAPIEDMAAGAVLCSFCMCITEASDELDAEMSSVHAALIAEVTERVKMRLRLTGLEQEGRPGATEAPPREERRGSVANRPEAISAVPGLDTVDLASDQSFPASDPPAWIGRHHTD